MSLGTKLTLKIFAKPPASPRVTLPLMALPPMTSFIEVFHEWIKRHVLTEPMIDVVDYGHVHNGPSVFFCGHESDYVIDTADGRVGLLYRRKRAADPKAVANGHDAALADSVDRLFGVAQKLEAESKLEGFAFDRSELEVALVDRLHVSNTDADFERVAPIVALTLEPRLGKVSLTRDTRDDRRPLTLSAKAR